MSRYWGTDVFSFFKVFFLRLVTLDFSKICADEVQIGVLSCIAICSAFVGPFLVLKKMTMFANSLSHTILLGIVLAFLLMRGSMLFDFSQLLLGAFIAAIITALLTEGLMKWFALPEDASVGLVFSFLFAVGILLVTLFARDAHLGLESVMGNVDALSENDLKGVGFLALLNGLVVILFYRQFLVGSFDMSFGKVLGLPVGIFRIVLLFLVSTTCVGAFRAVGVLLVLSFLVGPYLTARLFSNRLKSLIAYSACIGIGASVIGVALSRHILSVFDFPISTGGLVVCLIALFYFVGLGIKYLINSFDRRKAIPGSVSIGKESQVLNSPMPETLKR